MSRHDGLVVTFYSYKGGVGRSFIAANIAATLAKWGFRVLCVDWDLEAPGLWYYFQEYCSQIPDAGLVDIVDSFRRHRRPKTISATSSWQKAVANCNIGEGRLDALFSGNFSTDRSRKSYYEKLQRVDWDELYNAGFGDHLEKVRSEWIQEYDFVICDSRTGVTDIGGICTAQLPDILAVVFTANEQSLNGSGDITNRAMIARERFAYDRSKLLVLPIASRFDSRDEYEAAQHWFKQFVSTFSPHYESWLHRRATAEQIMSQTAIPYYPYWSFGERLPAVQEDEVAADPISEYFENIASLLSLRLSKSMMFCDRRDAYVALAKRVAQRMPQGSRFKFDVFMSYPSSNSEEAVRMTRLLEEQGLRVYVAEHAPEGDSPDERAAFRFIDNCQHMVLMLGDSVGRNQSTEIISFWMQSMEEQSERAMIPVILPGGNIRSLPPMLRQMRSHVLRDIDDIARVALTVAKSLRTFRDPNSTIETETA